GGRGPQSVVLEGGVAAGAADDARTARGDARARTAGQSSVGLRVRRAVPGAADSPTLRAFGLGAEARSGAARLRHAGQRRASRLSAGEACSRAERPADRHSLPGPG